MQRAVAMCQASSGDRPTSYELRKWTSPESTKIPWEEQTATLSIQQTSGFWRHCSRQVRDKKVHRSLKVNLRCKHIDMRLSMGKTRTQQLATFQSSHALFISWPLPNAIAFIWQVTGGSYTRSPSPAKRGELQRIVQEVTRSG
ncbi:uncharacterized protein LOC110839957 [Zootermopsis nevadensis]|uniref:uncharacterized protein LOC110839957 n=1 Tax=Zootermopsis nevadensis TaxID=136037 RepID=UPI000B8E4E62|nr:uncharacterized protein LOC110839957 [Zootermopsis nevadensis]